MDPRLAFSAFFHWLLGPWIGKEGIIVLSSSCMIASLASLLLFSSGSLNTFLFFWLFFYVVAQRSRDATGGRVIMMVQRISEELIIKHVSAASSRA